MFSEQVSESLRDYPRSFQAMKSHLMKAKKDGPHNAVFGEELKTLVASIRSSGLDLVDSDLNGKYDSGPVIPIASAVLDFDRERMKGVDGRQIYRGAILSDFGIDFLVDWGLQHRNSFVREEAIGYLYRSVSREELYKRREKIFAADPLSLGDGDNLLSRVAWKEKADEVRARLNARRGTRKEWTLEEKVLLAVYGDERFEDEFIQTFRADPDFKKKWRAAECLGMIGSRKALAVLKTGLRSEERHWTGGPGGTNVYLKDVCFRSLHYNLMSERLIRLSYTQMPEEIRELERLCAERFGIK